MYAVNQIPLVDLAKSETGCCTLIDSEEWDEQTFTFENKLFAVTSTRSFLYVPLNMAKVMADAETKIDAADARDPAFMILSQDVSPWRANHHFAVSKDVPGLKMEQLSGTYLAKVFEGPYKDASKWYKQLAEYVKAKGMKPMNTYLFYATCPKCAQVYGKNYVIGFEQVK